MIRRAILNVAVGQWYPVGQTRLWNSLEERSENTTRLFWRDNYPPGSPIHDQAPYGFKPYAFAAARALGFDQAVWLDSSVWILRPLDDVWSRIDLDGYYLEPDGHVVGEWISDNALGLLELSRDEAMEMPLIEGKMIGVDFRDSTAGEFLNEWLSLCDRGGFNGSWSNEERQVSQDARCRGHRHDIACASPLAHSIGMGLQSFKRLGFPANGEPGDELVALAQGL